MIGPAKEEKLATLFGALPDGMLRDLHRSLGRGNGPIDDALCRLIEQAAEARAIVLGEEEPLVLDTPAPAEAAASFVPPRNAMHAFFLPFESLIIDPPRYAERIEGYLCSTSLPVIWRMLNEEASGGVIRDAWVRAELSREDQGPEDYRRITQEMHAAARVVVEEIIARARDDQALRRTLVGRLGGPGALGDFTELHKMLPHIMDFQATFERLRPGLAPFGQRRAEAMADVILQEAGDNTVLNNCLQRAVLTNLDDPWQGLWLHRALNEAANDEVSIIADHLISVLQRQHRWLNDRLEIDGEDETLLLPFTGFSDLLAGMSEHEDLLEPGAAKNLSKLISAGRPVFEQLAETAAGVLERVLPTAASDGEEASPDLAWIEAHGEDPDTLAAANEAAAFLRAGEGIAPLYNREALWRGLQKETAGVVESYVTALSTRLAAMSGEEQARYQSKIAYLVPVAEALVDAACVAPLRKVAGEAAQVA